MFFDNQMINKDILITRLKFRLKILGFFIVFVFIFAIIGLFIFIFYAKNLDFEKCFCNKNQGIVVITGGQGRIGAGIRLLNDNCGKALLISGVGVNFNKRYLKKSFNIRDEKIGKIYLGYEASNTEGNAKEALVFSTIHEIEEILLVTNNYHIPRAKLLFKNFMPDKKIKVFILKSDENFLVYVTEYFKFIGTFLIYKTETLNKLYINYLRNKVSFWKNI